jgi:hypothetical protein
LIGVVAMRCAWLLSLYEKRHGQAPRDGSGRLVEVYPAAALKVWGQEPTGYKGKKGAGKRAVLVDWLSTATAPWLTAAEGVWRLCSDGDDALDAVLASLVARGAAVRQCSPIPVQLRSAANREGWIALPLPGSLSHLTQQSELHARDA